MQKGKKKVLLVVICLVVFVKLWEKEFNGSSTSVLLSSRWLGKETEVFINHTPSLGITIQSSNK